MKRKFLMNFAFVCAVTIFSISLFSDLPVMSQVSEDQEGGDGYAVSWLWCSPLQVYQVRCYSCNGGTCYASWQDLCE